MELTTESGCHQKHKWRLALPDKFLTNAESLSTTPPLNNQYLPELKDHSICTNIQDSFTSFNLSTHSKIELESTLKDDITNNNSHIEWENCLNTLFQQAKLLLIQKQVDWAIMTYEQIRYLLLNLPPSIDYVRKIFSIVKDISAQVSNEIEFQNVNRFREVLYLSERVGLESINEQIQLNILVSDSYLSIFKNNNDRKDIIVRIAAHLSEAQWLSYKYNKTSYIEEINHKLDANEARYIASLIPANRLIMRLKIAFTKSNYDIIPTFTMIERLIALMLSHQEFDYIKNIYKAGLVEMCLCSSENWSNEYSSSSFKMLTSLNDILLNKNKYYQEETSRKVNVRRGSKLISDRMKQSHNFKVPLSEKAMEHECPIPLAHESHWSNFRSKLESLRRNIGDQIMSIDPFNEESTLNIINQYNNSIISILSNVFQLCVDLVGNPPCIFCVIGLGSLGRKEHSLFSDIEYGIILYDESKRDHPYWDDLCNCFEFFVLCFGERAGFHVDEQGNPKSLLLKGSIHQIMELFTNQRMDRNSVGIGFSLLKPCYIYGYPEKPSQILYNDYNEKMINFLSDKSSSIYIAKAFIDDHKSLFKRFKIEDNKDFEIKTHVLQPMLYILTDICLYNGIFVYAKSGSILDILNLLAGNQHDILSKKFASLISKFYIYSLYLKFKVQLFYKEQFYSERVSCIHNKIHSDGTPYYILNREEKYWLDVTNDVIINPLMHMLSHYQETLNKKNIDPIIDLMNETIIKGSDYNHLRDIIKSVVATLVIREEPFEIHEKFYKSLDSDNQMFYKAKISQHSLLNEVIVKDLLNKLNSGEF